jgi:hypothetical protein
MTVNNHDEQGKDLPERVELVRAALPNPDSTDDLFPADNLDLQGTLGLRRAV